MTMTEISGDLVPADDSGQCLELDCKFDPSQAVKTYLEAAIAPAARRAYRNLERCLSMIRSRSELPGPQANQQ